MDPLTTGQWCEAVRGDAVVAGVDRLVARDPDGLDGWRLLVPDASSAAAARAHLRARTGGAAVVAARVTTPAGLLEKLAPADATDPLQPWRLRELARAVETAIRAEPQAFPHLAAHPPGEALTGGLAGLFSDLRDAGLDSRAAGAVEALRRVRPAGLGQELLRALGMIEGRCEALGLEDAGVRGARAAARAADDARRDGWLVAGFDYVPVPLLDVLSALAATAPVLWLRPHGRDDLRDPLVRSLAWSGAAPRASSDTDDPSPEVARETFEGPADLAARAIVLALETPGAAIVAARPEAWVSLLDAACSERGAVLAGSGRAVEPPPIAWLRQLVDAWAFGATAERVVDLIRLGAALRLRGWPEDPLDADRVDARLRVRGITRVGRDGRAALRSAGRAGQGLRDALDALSAPSSAADRLLALAGVLATAGLTDLVRRHPALVARDWSDQAARVAQVLEDLAGRLARLWPSGEPADTPALLVARLADALRHTRPARTVRQPGAGVPRVTLVGLAEPPPPGATRLIVLAPDEADLSGGRNPATRLVPDRVRATPDVATLAHFRLVADRRIALRQRLEAVAGGQLGSVALLWSARDVAGRERVPPPELGGFPGSPRAFPREPALRPPELDTGPGHRGGDYAARRSGLLGRGLSPSSSDAYRACPRRFYLERVIPGGDREPVSFDLDSRARGDWIHALLRALFKHHRGWWRPRPAVETVRELLEDVARSAGRRLVTGASEHFLRLQRASLLDAVAEAMAGHAETLAAIPALAIAGLELRMDAVAALDDRALKLRGTLDRLDLILGRDGRAVGCVVVDYKTGGASPYAVATDPGQRRDQLLLYAWLAEQVLGVPCLAAVALPVLGAGKARGVALADRAHPAVAAWLGEVPRADRRDRAGFELEVDGALERAFEAADGIRAGRFPASPASERECGTCSQALYCPQVVS